MELEPKERDNPDKNRKESREGTFQKLQDLPFVYISNMRRNYGIIDLGNLV